MSENETRKWEERWLEVQKSIMDLITSQRTSQQVSTVLETRMNKAEDHLDDLDDHLRGVVGEESMETRVQTLERTSTENNALLRKNIKEFDQIKKDLAELKIDQGSRKVARAMTAEDDATKLEWFKEWMRSFWSPIVLSLLAGTGWGIQYTVTHWDTIKTHWNTPSTDPVARMLDRSKHRKGTRGGVRTKPKPAEEIHDDPAQTILPQ